jgi:hypothetical protein
MATLTDMAQYLLRQMLHVNTEVVLESVKALGNLTASGDLLKPFDVDAVNDLFTLASTSNSSIQQATLGVFINLSGHTSSRRTLLRCRSSVDAADADLLTRLLTLLRKTALRHIIVSTQICKVF